MKCANCGAINGADSVFCVQCGTSMVPQQRSSMETEVLYGSGAQRFTPSQVTPVNQPSQGKRLAVIAGVTAVVALLAVALAAGVFYFSRESRSSEVLPAYLGLFEQSSQKDRVDEVQKQDFASMIEARNTFAKNETLRSLDHQLNLVLYSDFSVDNLRLIQLDTIKDDGTFRYLDFEAQPAGEKGEMKRIRPKSSLANGKYAFAITDGNFNEGKHKLWPFQVRNSTKGDNGDMLKASSLPLAPKPAVVAAGLPASAPPALIVPPPAGSTAARVISRNVLMRAGPSTGSPISGRPGIGQQVHVITYSNNECLPKFGCASWAFVQTSGGKTGYIFGSLLR